MKKLYRQIRAAFDDVLHACKLFEIAIEDKEVVRDAQVRFREKTNPILSKSYCINRARTWPQGYQGDYKISKIYTEILRFRKA